MVGDTLHWILLVLLIINLVFTGIILARGGAWIRRG